MSFGYDRILQLAADATQMRVLDEPDGVPDQGARVERRRSARTMTSTVMLIFLLPQPALSDDLAAERVDGGVM